jgi:hypothetical protein
VVIRIAMASASHLAWTYGRVQEEISKGLQESLSVPILDATVTGLGLWKEASSGLPRRLIT